MINIIVTCSVEKKMTIKSTSTNTSESTKHGKTNYDFSNFENESTCIKLGIPYISWNNYKLVHFYIICCCKL